MEDVVRVLLLEDNLQDEELLRETLLSAGLEFEVIRVDTETAFRNALDEQFELILSDYSLPSFDGRKALAIARELRPDIPFMFVSGTIGEEVAIESLLSGAADYVLKHRFGRLVPAVLRVLAEAEERRKRLKAEEELLTTSTQLRNLFENLDEVFFSLDPQSGQVLQVSPACADVYGLTPNECFAKPDFWRTAVHPHETHALEAAERVLNQGLTTENEYRIVQPGGTIRWVNAKMKPVSESGGQVTRVDAIVRDITERKELEGKFMRTQRLENLGSLAGGIAHDLNNILAPILMGLDLLRDRYPDSQDTFSVLRNCSLRGANLVRQVLLFARGADGLRATVNPARQITELQKILQSALPKSIRLAIEVPPDLWEISADSTQFEQVLMNLCVNARDAMPTGGELRISARNVPAEKEGRGPMIAIDVRDTGQGIAPDNLEKIFAPFFTTKAVGVGTGLGLSTVQTIVRSHGGTLGVTSTVGIGTAFHIAFPALPGETPTAQTPADAELPYGHGELVLVVEDEAAIRDLTQTVLEHCGYRVVVASNGQEGLDLYKAQSSSIDLVLTDAEMPVMSGEEMTRLLRQINPGVRVISTSGIGRPNSLANVTLEKPFSTEQLLQGIRMAL